MKSSDRKWSHTSMLNASFLKAGEFTCPPSQATPSRPPCSPRSGADLWQDKTAGSGPAGAAGWWHNKACGPRAGCRDDLRTPCVCQEEVTELLLLDISTCRSIGLAEALAHCCLGGQSLMWGDPEGLPTDILPYHPSGKFGDGDPHVFFTVQEDIFQV